MKTPHHTRCFATTKYTNDIPFYAQVVGNLKQKDDGSWCLVDCNGDEMPFGLLMKEFEGKLVCINFNNLIIPQGNWRQEVHHDAHCP